MKKKVKTKEPLERHKVLLNKILGNKGKPMSLGKAMRESGYTEKYSDNPQLLKKTRSWDILIKDVLNDELLAEKHLQLLNKQEIFNIDGELVKSGQAHSDVKQALDMAFKLKGKYSPEEVSLKFKGFSKEQLQDLVFNKLVIKKK